MLRPALRPTLFSLLALAACSSAPTGAGDAGNPAGSDAGPVSRVDAGVDAGPSMACGQCPSGYTCGTANNLPVCRAPSGIPLFSNVFIILMENTSLSTLQAAMNATPSKAPNLAKMVSQYATASDYHGVAHPSLPNYLALTSGSIQNTVCDCDAVPGLGTCSTSQSTCAVSIALGDECSCPNNAMNLADQLEAANKSWMAYGESMGTPCNLTDSGNYAQRHVPFLYYDDIQTNISRCDAHVVDFSSFSPDTAAAYTFIAPNLIDDMHNPDPTTSVNIPDGDEWIGPQVASIVASSTYKQGGLLVVVWDEDDGSGGLLEDTDDPIAIFVMSPYAKSGGFVSSVKANHYSLFATIEDGLDVPYMGMASSTGAAATLSDFFPAE